MCVSQREGQGADFGQCAFVLPETLLGATHIGLMWAYTEPYIGCSISFSASKNGTWRLADVGHENCTAGSPPSRVLCEESSPDIVTLSLHVCLRFTRRGRLHRTHSGSKIDGLQSRQARECGKVCWLKSPRALTGTSDTRQRKHNEESGDK